MQTIVTTLTSEIEAIQKDIEEKKANLKTKKSELKSAEKEVAKLEAKKAKADQKAAEEAKKAEAEDVQSWNNFSDLKPCGCGYKIPSTRFYNRTIILYQTIYLFSLHPSKSLPVKFQQKR